CDAGSSRSSGDSVCALLPPVSPPCRLASILSSLFSFFSHAAPTTIYTLSLHDALPIYRLPHRVHVERDRLAVIARTAEELLRLRLRRRSERQQRHVPRPGARRCLRSNLSLTVGLDELVDHILTVELVIIGDLTALGEHLLQLRRRLARLRGMSLIDDHREVLRAERRLQEVLDERERLQRHDDDQRRARQRVQQRPGLRAPGAAHSR